MPSLSVKLYSAFFKFLLKHRLQTRIQSPPDDADPFGVTSRPEDAAAAANPTFADGVATKDVHIDPSTSLSVRIFLPDSALLPSTSSPWITVPAPTHRRHSHGGNPDAASRDHARRNSYGCITDESEEAGAYGGYWPPSFAAASCRRLPVILQFHGGGFVSGSKDSVSNDFFCRRIAKACEVVVIAVGYRLAPENRYPAAFEDGMKALDWFGKQAKLAECGRSCSRSDAHANRHLVDAFGASMADMWLAAHGDPSRCVLLGVSCGANIADYVARKAVEAGRLLDPVKVVAQVLMYPFYIGSVPTHSEISLANAYFYDKALCILAWKLFLPEEEFSLDHPAANPLVPRRGPPLKIMPPTLTVVAEHDWMRDRAIAYSEELRKANIDAPVLTYKDAVHEFATLDMLLKTPEAQACAEDISIWVKKHISLGGHEFSY